ncbi:MAG TPA: DUF202 domain-containing protein [Streptosporangiaceae bacterium]|jgi:uncharacterized membrane protein YidH (DUF202 family)
MTPPAETPPGQPPPGMSPPGQPAPGMSPPGMSPPGAAVPGGPADLDPGLARERTRLAWTRTSIAFAAIGAAILKTQVVAGLIVLGLAAVVWGLRQLFRDRAPAGSSPAHLLSVTVIVVAVAVVALAIAIFGHPR